MAVHQSSVLILVVHGSRDPRWRASVEQLTTAVQTGIGRASVRLAYMEGTPTLGDVTAEVAASGGERVRVLPLFVTGEGHVERDIAPAVEDLRRTHPEIEVEFLPPVGQHRLFRDLLRAIAVGADHGEGRSAFPTTPRHQRGPTSRMTGLTNTVAPGTIYLVGAGPGDPGLISLRGVQCLERADLVLYDYLVNPVIVEHAWPEAEFICLGHPKRGRALPPAEITALMVDEARKGRTVVRLKGGDGSVFGRGADEADALRAAGVPFEIVPGTTTGLAVAAYCEIPITHREDASAVALVAGREHHSKPVSHLDYEALARFPGTLVVYMGVGTVREWSQALMTHGKAPDTPVAIVRWSTRAQQETVRCTLETVEGVTQREHLRPPAVFIVGKVVDRAPDHSWFESRPLFGTCVLVAGSQGTAVPLRDRLAALGAEVLARPAIHIGDPPDWAPADAALDRLNQYDWVVFSSGNGVDALIRRILSVGGDARRLSRVKLAAMGAGTAERLAAYHLRADMVPEEFVAESLAHALMNEAPDGRFLLARGTRGRGMLGDALERAGAHVDQVAVYSSMDVEQADPDVVEALAAGEIDWVAVTSSATARSLVQLYGDGLRSARFASIGHITSATLRSLGYEAAVEASPHTTAAMVDAILEAQRTVPS